MLMMDLETVVGIPTLKTGPVRREENNFINDLFGDAEKAVQGGTEAALNIAKAGADVAKDTLGGAINWVGAAGGHELPVDYVSED